MRKWKTFLLFNIKVDSTTGTNTIRKNMFPLSITPYCISLCNGIRLINNTTFQPKGGGGGVTAIYLPHGDMSPIRVYFLAFKSKIGCLFSSLTLKQGVRFVLSPQTRIHIHSTVWHPSKQRRFSPEGDGGSGRRPLPSNHFTFW